ncbi:YgaP family membrane protein [Reichenbachiella ulvae]|uniref:DUF2892 domain-containing protein n=1 Tax=Reichenbachiella ulvae TaxID=2980104 RepID=A0ABT3CY72_9BACT|nr:DUF2892 domain-containing protein [Reichenbachiella ulvae]MCV9388647.1 DUF2892 domain-containing protein [Reichenbachiella ulvae]
MNKLIESLTYSFAQNMNGTDRGLRLVAGLSEPLLSLTGVISGPLETVLNIAAMIMVVSGFSGKCFIYHLTGKCSLPTQPKKTSPSKELCTTSSCS